MGENSRIEWTDHTHNIVWGCQKVSPACENCYAEAWDRRLGGSHWGPRSERRVLSDSYWRQPLKWDRLAGEAGVRARVFCSSMADVFEDHPTVNGQRERLWDLILKTQHLDWLLLTKRPENLKRMLPWSTEDDAYPWVWVGVTAESQDWANRRVPILLDAPAYVRFVSCEPLLGPLELGEWLTCQGCGYTEADKKLHADHGLCRSPSPTLDWVIVGGESGPGARPMWPQWAESIRDECVAAGTAFHFKQWGDLIDDPEMPGSDHFIRIGKKAAGRELGGRTWDQLPSFPR